MQFPQKSDRLHDILAPYRQKSAFWVCEYLVSSAREGSEASGLGRQELGCDDNIQAFASCLSSGTRKKFRGIQTARPRSTL